MISLRIRAAALVVSLTSLPDSTHAQEAPFEFTRMIAHWDEYGHADYLPFVDDVQPQVAQVGFYGAHFWSLVHTPQFGGYPAHFPVRGLTECSAWFRTLNGELKKRKVRAVGHFNIEFLVGDPDGPMGPRGFFKWYRDHWDEKRLGPKPVKDPLDFLEKKADGTPIVNRSYAIGGMSEYWACLRNPHWQIVLKAWVKQGIALGVDGYVINYFYRHECHCDHCQSAFRSYLSERHSPAELKKRFRISDLAAHKFGTIVSWHDPKTTNPLKLEMLRFSQVSNKKAFDEVFLKFGRSLKPDLLVAQWNHLGNFVAISGDERCLLPADLWAKDESYLWYSTGDSANKSDLENRVLGDAVLQARFIRGASGDKPFTLGKYESTRIRTTIAELAANGGTPMGFYARFTDPEARKEIVRYYQFLKRHENLYQANHSHAEVILAYPRKRVHQGDLAALERFRTLGRKLLDRHVLFDIFPDDLVPTGRDKRHKMVFTVDELSPVLPKTLSRFDAPFTVRVSASRPATRNELDLHFVNYNRTEPPKRPGGKPSAGNGIRDEKPIPAPEIAVDLLLPPGARVKEIVAITPEDDHSTALKWKMVEGRIQFSTPPFKVYALVRVLLHS